MPHSGERLERPSQSEYFFQLARLAAARSTCPRAAVGAVITRGGRIISTGYNGAPPGVDHCTEVGCDTNGRGAGCGRTTHAEANAIAFAARHGTAVEGAELWTTHSPCVDCAKLILAAGIVQVNYEHGYRDPAGRELLAEGGVLA